MAAMGSSPVIYAYRCRSCGHSQDSRLRADTLGPCSSCAAGEMRRVWAVNVGPVMHEHFNQTVGKPISSMRQFEAELRRVSDERTAATGIEHRYAPVDPTDRKALGVTSEGLEATNRARVAAGLKPVPVD